MSQDEPTPDWNLLPYQAEAFFQLPKEYDRTDLKRAYNRLLKRFKPDTFPQEFQKLRAAFEQLDAQMRYRESSGQSPDDEPAWASNLHFPSMNAPTFAPHPERDSPGTNAESDTLSPADALLARLREVGAESMYQELAKKPTPSSLECYWLAILSDAVFEPNQLKFAEWLLVGLQRDPHESALFNLLYFYFRDEQLPESAMPRLLLETSRVIRTDRFYFLTESLWDRLVRSMPWDELESLLAQCRANINDHRIQGNLVFTCHLLRRAVWVAPLHSAEQLLDYLEANADLLSGGLDFDLEFNSQLLSYVRGRQAFVNRGKITTMIDDALRMYCLDPGHLADAKVSACQSYISQNPSELFDEVTYPMDGREVNLTPWIWACEDVLERSDGAVEVTASHAYEATFNLLKQIDRLFPTIQLEIYNLSRWALMGLGYVFFMIVPTLIGVIVMALMPMQYLNAATFVPLVLAFVGVGFFHFWVKPRTFDLWLGKYLERLVIRNYRSWWRGMIARFHAATHFSHDQVQMSASHLVYQQHEHLNVSTWLPRLYAVDAAMVLYASAVRFLR
jgi:hypothetical protein